MQCRICQLPRRVFKQKTEVLSQGQKEVKAAKKKPLLRLFVDIRADKWLIRGSKS